MKKKSIGLLYIVVSSKEEIKRVAREGLSEDWTSEFRSKAALHPWLVA